LYNDRAGTVSGGGVIRVKPEQNLPLNLAKDHTSYWTREFEDYMFPHEADLTERETARLACQAAVAELRADKPAYWALLEMHTLGRQTFKVCAAREGITVTAAQKRHQRALRCLQDTALRIKAGIETGTT
jgi:hypothetical protein